MSDIMVELNAFDVTGLKELSRDIWHMLITHKARGGMKMFNHYLMWSSIFMIIFAVIYFITYFVWDNIVFRNKTSVF